MLSVFSGLFWSYLSTSAWLPWWLRWWRISLQWGRPRFNAWDRKIPWRREWLSTSAFLAGESHRQSSLAGHCAWGCKESDTTEKLTLSLSHFCIDLKLIYSGLSKGSLSSLWHVVLSHFSHIQLFKWHYSMTQWHNPFWGCFLLHMVLQKDSTSW